MDALNHLSDGAVVAIVIFVSLAIFAALWWFDKDKGSSNEHNDENDKIF